MPAFASGVAAVCCSQGEARHSFPRQDRSPTASAVHTLCAQMSVCKTWRQVIQHHGLSTSISGNLEVSNFTLPGPWRSRVLTQPIYGSLYPLTHIPWQALDLFPRLRKYINLVLHSNSPLISFHGSHPAFSRSPFAFRRATRASLAISKSSRVSSHSTNASQSSASRTTKRLPLTVTYCTDCRASSPVISTPPDSRFSNSFPVYIINHQNTRPVLPNRMEQDGLTSTLPTSASRTRMQLSSEHSYCGNW